MALTDVLAGQSILVGVVAFVAIFASLFTHLFLGRQPFPTKAPAFASKYYPIVGSLQFFTRRWDFMREAHGESPTGNFSYYAGKYRVVGLDGRKAEHRKLFFDSKALSMSEGYAALLGGTPDVKEGNNPLANSPGSDESFSKYFQTRLTAIIKGSNLARTLPTLLKDARRSLDTLVAQIDPKTNIGVTDPFDSIYRMVFQFTMRTVAADEIADDQDLLARCLSLFETIESSGTAATIMYPFLPLPAKIRRTYAGYQLYVILQKIVNDRKAEGRRGNDAMQFLIDQNDSISLIITFVLGSLFAGQLNTGVNAGWILLYMTQNPYWLEKVRQEVNDVADRYCPDKSMPLKERLMQVPYLAWEGEFPIMDMALKDVIRLQMSGSAFRRNVLNEDLPIDKEGKEVIPAGAYVSLAVGDIHYNESIYENEQKWDPSRYASERAEHEKEKHAFIGWGVGRHPCLGMKFAKLENNLIVAFFLAYFDNLKVLDGNRQPTDKLPATDRNSHTAKKPREQVFLSYSLRKD